MVYYQVQAVMSGNRTKTLINKNESSVLTDIVLPFISTGTLQIDWGGKKRSYQVLEVRIFKTKKIWDKKSGIRLEKFTKRCRNVYSTFEKKAQKILQSSTIPVFIIMPIQGDNFGTQDNQRIFKEFDTRFKKIERLLQNFNCTAIRIDKEYALDELVKRIKNEIERAQFVIADLTEERPSCYFEAGYGEAKGKPIIYIASKESVIKPREKTSIHFDIHRNVNYFTNQKEMVQKIKNAINKNKTLLFKKEIKNYIPKKA
jgi:Tfp pilus assembly PilM family ATPase